MNNIYHDFFIKATAYKIFYGVSKPSGLDTWWTEKSSGKPAIGEEYSLGFGPGYNWKAVVTKCIAGKEFELEMKEADTDWNSTRVGFIISDAEGGNQVKFYHTGWPKLNEHFRISSYCWAMYLRLLKRNLETGEVIPYAIRLEV
ncbi:MAG: SRPBCC domain-containing protein [Bacteroidia bacterium]